MKKQALRLPSLSFLLYLAGALLSLGGLLLRLNHHITLGLCFALLTAGLLLTRQARRLRSAQTSR